jgi:hypothetical protein
MIRSAVVGIHYAIGAELDRGERSLVMAAVHRAVGRAPFVAEEVALFGQLATQLRLTMRQHRLAGRRWDPTPTAAG